MEKEARVIKIDEHIYFVNDEEIKEGDWVYNEVDKKVFQVHSKEVAAFSNATNYIWKVVATTNPELKGKWIGTCFSMEEQYERFPKIGLDFVERFVKEEGKITQVLLEYEKLNTGYTPITTRLKLRSSGTVYIHPIQPKMYSEEEVLSKLKLLASHTKTIQKLMIGNSFDIDDWWNHNK